MTWNLTMLGVHLLALGALIVIFPRAPGGMQKVFWLIAGSGFAWIAICYGSRLIGVEVPDGVVHLGYMSGHYAALVSLIRIFVVDQERRCLPTSSQPSRN